MGRFIEEHIESLNTRGGTDILYRLFEPLDRGNAACIYRCAGALVRLLEFLDKRLQLGICAGFPI